MMFCETELNQLYRYCFSLVNNEADAYDLLQTALEKYLRRPPNKEQAKFSYIRAIIRNTFIDYYRSLQKNKVQEYDENTITNIHDGLATLEEISINEQSADLIWSLLDSSEREIMYLWTILGMSTTEVANYLKVPKGTVVSKISRLRNRVTQQLSKNIECGAI